MSLRFELSPELSDGTHKTICNTGEQLIDAVRAWVANGYDEGDDFSVRVIEMSDAEVATLPEI